MLLCFLQCNDHISFFEVSNFPAWFSGMGRAQVPNFWGDFWDEKLMGSWEFDNMIWELSRNISSYWIDNRQSLTCENLLKHLWII